MTLKQEFQIEGPRSIKSWGLSKDTSQALDGIFRMPALMLLEEQVCMLFFPLA